ncbi:dihydrofolate reductase family protein [Streptomyces sp. ACA25]|uniref:dihydrofolate reductase family protein n=1 Tax=Streptomyces sp. ACA25 TaxID=3022596 RepID=UPI002307394E|nr:dihydrofolate reductase family protein [Streptomyces sp. ACA25]MDB1087242.1 dihydrofolate reductase family protein [Streptomyces sp. ACA25]
MRPLTYYVGISLDGFIAGPEGEIDFYPVSDDHVAHMTAHHPEVLPTHVRRQLGIDDTENQRFDTLVMGRGTYQPALDVGITSPYAHLRQYVFSRSLTEQPDPAVEIVAGDPLAKVRELKQEDSPLGIWLCGGGQLAGQLLPEIDRLVIKKYPVVTGSGIPAFVTGFHPHQFTLTDCLTFGSGCAVLSYDRKPSPGLD